MFGLLCRYVIFLSFPFPPLAGVGIGGGVGRGGLERGGKGKLERERGGARRTGRFLDFFWGNFLLTPLHPSPFALTPYLLPSPSFLRFARSLPSISGAPPYTEATTSSSSFFFSFFPQFQKKKKKGESGFAQSLFRISV